MQHITSRTLRGIDLMQQFLPCRSRAVKTWCTHCSVEFKTEIYLMQSSAIHYITKIKMILICNVFRPNAVGEKTIRHLGWIHLIWGHLCSCTWVFGLYFQESCNVIKWHRFKFLVVGCTMCCPLASWRAHGAVRARRRPSSLATPCCRQRRVLQRTRLARLVGIMHVLRQSFELGNFRPKTGKEMWIVNVNSRRVCPE